VSAPERGNRGSVDAFALQLGTSPTERKSLLMAEVRAFRGVWYAVGSLRSST
jgi:hypothetical protein